MIDKKIIVLGILLGTGIIVHNSFHTAHSSLIAIEATNDSMVRRTILIGTSSSQILVAKKTPKTEPFLEKSEIKTLKRETTGKASLEASTHGVTSSKVFSVPFYSQFTDISSATWKKVGCGVTSLAMLIDYYKPGTVEVDTLLQEGITAGAYLDSAGWTYAGLIGISKKYGLGGNAYDRGGSTMESAFNELTATLKEGPVMASVHYSFDPQNPIPHLVVVNGVKDGMVYYNDPAEKTGAGSISISKFQKSWKKRYIEIRPLT